jgi:hypothetical protein
MYSNKLVACIKADGKVLREKGDNVYLPFGSEYELYFKNDHSRKVQIEVTIDGEDVLNGKALLLSAGESMDLKGFVRDIDGMDNRAFKFIEKTNEISDFRGDRAEDGLVKVSYTFEREQPTIRHEVYGGFQDTYRTYTNCGPEYGNNPMDDLSHITLGGIFGAQNSKVNISDNSMNISYSSNSVSNSVGNIQTNSLSNMNLGVATTSATVSDEPGITVEGSATNQSFKQGYIGSLEMKSHTMIFQLKGITENEVIEAPVTVKSKKQCPSCGKKYKSSFEYCPQDGTFLR